MVLSLKHTHTHTHTHISYADTHCMLWQGPHSVGAGAIWRPGRGNEAPPVAHVSDSASNWLSCRLFPPVPLPPPNRHPPHLISITMGRHRVESWPRPPLCPRASLTVSLSSSSLVCPPSRTPQDWLLLTGSPFLSASLSCLYPHSSGCIPIITSLPLSPSSLTISKLLSCGSHLSCFFLSLPSPLPSVLYLFLFFFSLEQSGVT